MSASEPEGADQQAMDDLADRFFAAIERGDLDTVHEIYHPEAEVWINTVGRVQTREQNGKLLSVFVSRVADRHYEVQERRFFPGGFVQRHLLRGRVASGEEVAAPVCLVIHVENGRIRRLFEYMDAAALAAAFPPRG